MTDIAVNLPTTDEALVARCDALAAALEITSERLDGEVRERIQRSVDGVRERLELGVGHTVVALAGGTGSGKSSLFNAISRLDFADVGIMRPTTSEVTAASWDDGAEAMLDWIGVTRQRRIIQANELGQDVFLDGLVLLDLPDHDSIEAKHRESVDRVLPLVDLLIWVVDPQKYADDALHSGYLRESAGTEASMLVVLNQMDTVPLGRREELIEDLRRLIDEDGLDGVDVMTASAVTGVGVTSIRRLLETVCKRQTIAAGRASAELDLAARALATELPTAPPWRVEPAVERALPDLVEATGLDSVAGQVGAAVRNHYGRGEFGATDRDSVSLLRARWLSQAGMGLPAPWRRELASAVPTTDEIHAAAHDAIRAVDLEASGMAGVRAWRRVAASLMLLGALAAIATILALVGVFGDGFSSSATLALAILGAVGLAGGFVVLWVVRAAVQRRAVARSEAVQRSGRRVLKSIIESRLGAPTLALLAEYERAVNLSRVALGENVEVRADTPSVARRKAPSKEAAGN